MSTYTLSDNIKEYLDHFSDHNPDDDLGMYATIYAQVKEATQGPYKDPQELLSNNTNKYK